MSTEVLKATPENTKTINYAGGTISYASFGEADPDRPKMFIIPGFTEDSLTMKDFAEALANQSGTEVIVPDQPSYYRGKHLAKGLTMSALNHQAEAYLAVIEAEGLGQQPVDFVAHSLGAPVEVRMAEMAKERGIISLEHDHGSRSVFMAPAGTNPNERLLLSKDALAIRFMRDFMPRDQKEIKRFDPQKIGSNRAAKNFVKNPIKTGKEIWYLSKKESMYPDLGRVGLKPGVLVFSDDPLLPQRLNEAVTEAYVNGEEDYSLSGWAMAVNVSDRGVRQGGKNEWLEDYRRAGHNDHARHPEHVAEAVLQLLRQA